ncbi:NAD(P)-dependent oxidoreductase [Saccharomonospora sp. NPDC046836]|uniref:NAD-dependent epimerase/dehydratase family protein n=1 Tax=Saccharomonospora sp. NPDC046836 TaxID=3156921 RepID=UPI003408EAB1
MNVLVTGASGRVGANMVRRLVAEGIDVKAMVIPGDPQVAKLARFRDVPIVEADLGDQESVDAACKGVTHVVHLAAQLVRGDTPVDRFYDTNALGTLRLLEGIVRSGVPLERFVLASSDGTYRPGAPPAIPLREDVPQLPGDYYGTSKLLGEVILRNHAYQYDLPFAIVRFATVVSPEEAGRLFRRDFWKAVLHWQSLGKESHLWPLFHGQPDLQRVYAQATEAVPPDTAVGLTGPTGQPWTLSLVDVRDAVEGVYRALVEPAALSTAFNIAAARPTTHADGAAIVSEIFGVPKLMVPMPMDFRLELNVELARKRINYQPGYDYREMVESARSLSSRDVIPASTASGVASTWQE